MKNIRNDIKTKSFRPVYLIFGEEGHQRDSAAKSLENAVLEDSQVRDTFGENFDVTEFINCANTLSLFGGYRLISVKDSGVFSSGSDERLLNYMKDPNPDAVIIFNEKKVDKRGRLYKAVSKTGYSLECKKLSPKDIRNYCIGKMKSEGKNLEKNSLELLLSNLGDDMSEAENEVQKLLSYTDGSSLVTCEDVENIVTKKLEGRVFDLIDALCLKKTSHALEILSNMLLMKENPVMITVAISRQLRLMLQYKFLARSMPHDEITKKMKLHPYAAKKIAYASKGFSNKALMGALKDCRNIIISAFSGDMELERGIEILILKYTN